jgi:hypothetical protein
VAQLQAPHQLHQLLSAGTERAHILARGPLNAQQAQGLVVLQCQVGDRGDNHKKKSVSSFKKSCPKSKNTKKS